MSNQVYANMMEVSCKSANGKTICAFPDVCMTPPQTPATPPGVPIPYPNTGMASDATDGSTSVKISGKEVMLKNKSCFSKSTGDEAGAAPKKGLVTSKNTGKVYFNMWSMDVKVEGENVVRHLDITTHNHSSVPGNSPPMSHMDGMTPPDVSSCEDCDSDSPCTGSPVSILSGSKFLSAEEDLDFTMEGPLPLQWQRSYRSRNTHIGWLGRGWCTPLEISLRAYADAKGTVVERLECVDQSGRQIALDPLERGKSAFHAQNQTRLARDLEGTYSLTSSQGIEYHFLPCEDGVHRLGAIRDRNGNVVRISYFEEHGRMVRITVRCSGGQELELRFVDDRVASIQALRHSVGGSGRVDMVRYVYDVGGNLIAVVDRAGRTRRRFAYNDLGLMNWQQFAGSFEAWYEYSGVDAGAKVIRQRDNCGRAWTYDYHSDRTIVSDGDGHVTTYFIDKNRRWIGTLDAMGHYSTRGVDHVGRVKALVDPLQGVTEIAYDERGNPVEVIDSSEGKTIIGWDERFDRPISVIDPLNRETAYSYDEHANLVAMRDACGHKTSWTYDSRGLVTSIKDANGGTARLEYDEHGRLVCYIDCSGSETRYRFDTDGLVVAITSPSGSTTRLTRDATGNVVRHELADGSYEAYTYDDADRVLTLENGLGLKFSYSYTPDGLVTERRDACGGVVRYDYDGGRRLIKLTNENRATYAFAYDPLGRIIRETRFDGTSISHAYDGGGRLVESLEGHDSTHGIRTCYRTDRLGRVIESETGHSLRKYQFDALGRLVRAWRDGVDVRFVHDPLDRVIEESMTTHDFAYVLRHRYDPLGNRIETTLPDGTRIGALHYGSGHVHQLLLDDQPVADFVRDRQHRQIERTQGVATVSWTYDPAGRPRSRQVRGIQDDVLLDRNCEHDIAGRIASSTTGSRQHRYAYDKLDRLIAFDDERFDFDPASNLLASVGEGVVADNRTRAGVNCQYRYDVYGRVTHKQAADGGETLRLVWDEQHLLVQSQREGPAGNCETRYQYDAFGRRIAKHGAAGTIWFVWDGDQVMGEVSSTLSRFFIYEPSSQMPLAQVTRPAGSANPAVGVYYYHCEESGLPFAITDGEGRLRWTGSGTAWGAYSDEHWNRARSADDEAESDVIRPEPRLRFMGQYWDEETGLCYNRNRYYDPDIASFLTHDPIGLWASENTYKYPTNPLQMVDPLGLVIVYHYTSKAGYKAITSDKIYRFKASTPSREGKPKGVYVSPLGPADLCAKDYKAKLGVTREKSEYFIAFDVDPSKLRRIPGGRGDHVLYAPEDLEIDRSNVVAQGETPKKKKC